MSASTDAELDTPAKPARRHSAAVWALAGALCAGGVWAVGSVATFAAMNVALQPADIKNTLGASLFVGGTGALVGLIAGAVVGLSRRGNERDAVASALSQIGVLAGVIGGGLSAPTVVALGSWVHPVGSSALAWSLAGFVAGLLGHSWSRWAEPPAPSEDEEPETDEAAPRRVEWLLRQREPRRLRDWPLFRVLPLLIVSALLLVGAAAVAPSDTAVALAAAGAVGLAAALVLHAQEYRLRHLEARLRDLERRSRDTREEGA